MGTFDKFRLSALSPSYAPRCEWQVANCPAEGEGCSGSLLVPVSKCLVWACGPHGIIPKWLFRDSASEHTYKKNSAEY